MPLLVKACCWRASSLDFRGSQPGSLGRPPNPWLGTLACFGSRLSTRAIACCRDLATLALWPPVASSCHIVDSHFICVCSLVRSVTLGDVQATALRESTLAGPWWTAGASQNASFKPPRLASETATFCTSGPSGTMEDAQKLFVSLDRAWLIIGRRGIKFCRSDIATWFNFEKMLFNAFPGGRGKTVAWYLLAVHKHSCFWAFVFDSENQMV